MSLGRASSPTNTIYTLALYHGKSRATLRDQLTESRNYLPKTDLQVQVKFGLRPVARRSCSFWHTVSAYMAPCQLCFENLGGHGANLSVRCTFSACSCNSLPRKSLPVPVVLATYRLAYHAGGSKALNSAARPLWPCPAFGVGRQTRSPAFVRCRAVPGPMGLCSSS